MADPIFEQVFTVARGDEAITSYQMTQAKAEADLARVQAAMVTASLTPDIVLATVEKTTTYGKPIPITA
ncbi:hypothetical protein FHW23_000193 [Curtobacterium pusillum]|uniref:DUF2922 domain-containing protein n=1 Tax=Curtobacterium pusillum TaxID=69373 RepID=A0AAW3SYV6_9MICO|nr:hypothetical protein [Curtobacterium pusillum]MBA8988961.1 hypothetical protein [Curtobacterium pusillum]